MTEKVLGYSLLVVGLLVILFAAVSVYFIFTKQTEPVKLFNLPGLKLDIGALMAGSVPQEFRGMVPSSKQEIIPAETINQPLNLYSYLFLMGFVATIGYKIASLGIMLVRPIVVKVKEANK